MANIVIWGKTRDLLAGTFPAGITALEVDSLAALRESLDGSATLILADPARIEADREAVEAWLQDEGSQRGLLVAITDGDDGDDGAIMCSPGTGTTGFLRP